MDLVVGLPRGVKLDEFPFEYIDALWRGAEMERDWLYPGPDNERIAGLLAVPESHELPPAAVLTEASFASGANEMCEETRDVWKGEAGST